MTDRTEEAPRVFGVGPTTTVTGETAHTWRFGPLEVGLAYIAFLDGSPPRSVPWWVGKQRGLAMTLEEAVATIESELTAIADAINAARAAQQGDKT